MSQLIRRTENVPSPSRDPQDFRPQAGAARLGWDDREEISLPGMLQFVRRLVWRRAWLILLVAAVVTGTAGLQVLTMSPLYKATARIQILPDGSLVLPYQEVSDATVDFLATEAYVQTQKKILEGRALAGQVAQRLDLARSPEFQSQPHPGIPLSWLKALRQAPKVLFSDGSQPDPAATTIDTLMESLEIRQVLGTRLLDVDYVSHDPNLAYEIADSFVQEYTALELTHWREVAEKTAGFLRSRMGELRQAIEASEAKLNDFAREKGILTLDEGQEISLRKLGDLSEQVTQLRARLTALEARQEVLKSAGPDSLPMNLRTETIIDLENKLYQLKQQEASLSARFGRNWPARLQTEHELAEVRAQLRQEREGVLKQAGQEYLTVQKNYQQLAAQLERETRKANKAGEDLLQYSLLRSEAQGNKDLHAALLQRLKEVTLTSSSEVGNVRLIEPVGLPRSPYWPRKANVLMIACAVGLLFGLGAAIVMESMGKVVETPEDVERCLGIACLGSIPQFRRALHLDEVQALGGGSPQQKAQVAPIATGTADALGWEAYRSLRTALLLSSSGGPPQTMMVTSALAGEGKTVTAVNTAISLAQAGIRTLLVDLDLRKPQIASIFGLEEGSGISLYLSGHAQLHSQLHSTAIPNLSVLPAGLMPPNPAELIGSDRMDLALKLLGEAFGAIVIDSPPVLPVTDAVVLSPKVDGVILVAGWARTSADSLRRAKGALWSVGGRILGVVINSIKSRSPSYGHYMTSYPRSKAS